MKNKLLIMLLAIVSLFAVALSANANDDANNEVVVNELNELLNYYYDNGTYTKHTKIYVNTEKVQEDFASYFHAECTDVERTTYYDGDALWMSRGPEGEGVKYSYYGTHYVDGVAKGVTNATTDEPLVHPENPRVVLSGEGKNSMNEYYVTLDDIFATAAEGWQKDSSGVYYTSDANVLDDFRNFVAPLWLNTEKSRNYLHFSLATIEEVNDKLVLKLWVSATEIGKLHASETRDDNMLFAVADIKAPYIFKDVTFEGEGTYLDYIASNMIDNDLSTFAWFVGVPTSVVFELRREVLLTDISIYQMSGQPSGPACGDKMAGTIEVSTNGVDYTPVGKLEYDDHTYLNLSTPLATKYIRITNTSSETWAAIREILINQNPSVSLNGFKHSQFELSNIFDGNPDTYWWLETVGQQKDCGFVLDYGKMVEFNTINIMTAPASSGNDCLWGFKLSYSNDGVTYYDLIAVTADHADVRNYTHQTPTHIKARYIKVEGLGDVTYWLHLHEFSLSTEEVVGIKPIFAAVEGGLVFDGFVDQNGFPITIDSKAYSVYYSNDFGTYNELPIEPGWYSIIVELDENSGFKLIDGNKDFKHWVSFEVKNVQKVNPEISVSIENGTTLYIGVDDAPTVTINPDMLSYEVFYTKDDGATNLGTEFPTTPGTYAINVRVFETNEYNYVSTFRWFILAEAPTQNVIMVDAVIYSKDGKVHFDGFIDADGNYITDIDSSLYRVYYSSETAEYDEYPTEPGSYSIVVEFVEEANYEFITKNIETVTKKIWRGFKVEAAE